MASDGSMFDALEGLVSAIKAWSSRRSMIYAALKKLPKDFVATLRARERRFEELQQSNQAVLLRCRELEAELQRCWRPWPPKGPTRSVDMLRIYESGLSPEYIVRVLSTSVVPEPATGSFYREVIDASFGH